MSKRDYYEILGLDKSASAGDIKKSYRKLAMKYHPDQNPGDAEAEKKFKEAAEAYEILKDEQKKSAYDRMGHAAFSQGGGGGHGGFGQQGFSDMHNVHDIFGDIFGEFMGGGGRARRASKEIRGSDLKYNISVSLEDAFKGVEKSISFRAGVKCEPCHGTGSKNKTNMTNCSSCGGQGTIRRQQGFFAVEQTCGSCGGMGQVIKDPCSKCSGTGRHDDKKDLLVKIPSGVEDGTRIRLTGEGEAGMRGGNPGDLYIFVEVKPHDVFRVDNAALHCRIPLSFTQAILGAKIQLPTIEGGKVELVIPKGTQNGDKLRIRDRGMSKVRNSQRGDMIAHVHIEIPKVLNKKQKELLEELDKEFGGGAQSEKSFFDKMKNLWQ